MTLTTLKLSGRGSARYIAGGLPAEIGIPGERIACETANVSRSGVWLTGRFPLPLMSPLNITLMSARRDVQFHSHARIARIERNRDGTGSGVGIEFQNVTDDERRHLEAIISRLVEATGSGGLEAINPQSRPEEIRAALSKMSVTHRVAMAMRAGAIERRYLRKDGNPKVLAALARNPSVNLDEILSLARMHQLLPTTLGIIVADRRWRNSEELMIVIASHPKATLSQAEKAASHLNDRAMDRLLQRPNLHPTLRDKLLSPAARKRLRG